MRAIGLAASLGAHVIVLATMPSRGSKATHEEPDDGPIEVVVWEPPAAIETRAPPEPIAEPEVPDAPPPAETAAPAPEPPPPPPPARRPRTPPRVPTESAASDAAPDVEVGEVPDQAEPSKPARRRLGLQLSNAPEGGGAGGHGGDAGGGGRGSGGGDATPTPTERPAAGGCEEPPTKPRAIRRVPIEYPAAARAAGIEGKLVLRAEVSASGVVSGVSIVRSVGKAVDEPARDALQRWTFEPATRCGVAVRGQFTVAREFRLGD